ncbi:MAG: IS200/IS605 family transposase [Planctomycetaceae bacterium]
MPSSHCQLLYHVVFSTKERRPLITGRFRIELYRYITGIVSGQRGDLLELGGIADHLHLLMRLPTDLSIADCVRLIKANSSKWANERTDLVKWFRWQRGYGAFTVSQSQAGGVRRYIRSQEQHHRRRSFQDEFLALLEKNEVTFDPKYIWE